MKLSPLLQLIILFFQPSPFFLLVRIARVVKKVAFYQDTATPGKADHISRKINEINDIIEFVKVM